jgi:hypothetical protein
MKFNHVAIAMVVPIVQFLILLQFMPPHATAMPFTIDKSGDDDNDSGDLRVWHDSF